MWWRFSILAWNLSPCYAVNSIYSIHLSYQSIIISFSFVNIIIIFWLFIWYSSLQCHVFLILLILKCIVYSFFQFFYLCLSFINLLDVILNFFDSLYFINFNFIFTVILSLIQILFLFYSILLSLFSVFYSLWLCILNWLNDLYIEYFLFLIRNEQCSLINGIKLLIYSEFMLFYSCFWSFINFKFCIFCWLFIYPLLCIYSFTISFSNLFILIFSSFPIQASQIFIKIGLFIITMEGLGHSICCGYLFIILQCKEFIYSYFSLSDSIIGSIFYFTTALHGIHVVFGCLFYCFILFLPCFTTFYFDWFYLLYMLSFIIPLFYQVFFINYYIFPFETVLKGDDAKVGSIAAGGRYDNLIVLFIVYL